MTLLQFSSSYCCTGSRVAANYVASSGHLESKSLPLTRLANEISVSRSGSSPGRTVKKDTCRHVFHTHIDYYCPCIHTNRTVLMYKRIYIRHRLLLHFAPPCF